MKHRLYDIFIERKKAEKKCFAVLIDPDKVDEPKLDELMELSLQAKVDYFLLGGSLVISSHLDQVVQYIKSHCNIPVILFPGSPSQVSKYADALLYLSLISGRNPELLIGQMAGAPLLRKWPRNHAHRLYGNRWRRVTTVSISVMQRQFQG
jgi:putative glycerol-1-phosphate prenyltransferase